MLGEIETQILLLLRDAQADGRINELENNVGDDTGQGGGEQHALKLVHELAAASDKRHSDAAGFEGIFDRGIDLATGKESQKEHSDRASQAVHAKNVQRIVITQLCFQLGDGQQAPNS